MGISPGPAFFYFWSKFMGEIEGVNAEVASDAAGAGSAPGAGDAAGQTFEAASGAPDGSGAPNNPALEGAADAGSPEGEDDFSEYEGLAASAPPEWREKFNSLLDGHKSLRTDHRQLRSEHERLSGLYSGMTAYARDESGKILVDPSTGLPVFDPGQFVSGWVEDNPASARAGFYAMAQQPIGEGGATLAQEFFRQLGLDPGRLDDYLAITKDPTLGANYGATIPPDELDTIPEAYHETYKTLSPEDRLRAQQMDDFELSSFMRERQDLRELQQFKQTVEQEKAERERAEIQAFWQDVERQQVEYANQLRAEGFASIQKSLTDQVQFSADPTVNAVQTGAVMTMVAAMLEPGLQDVVNPVLQSLGIQSDASLQQMVSDLQEQIALEKRLEAINSHPKLTEYKNEAMLRQVKADVNRGRQMVTAKLSGVASKIAKAIAGGNQQMRDMGRTSVPRPAFSSSNGQAGASMGTGKPAPFTTDWLEQRRAGQI